MTIQLIVFLIHFIEILTSLLMWCLFIWVIMSWVSSSKSRIGEILDSIIKPILRPFRWARIGMIDLSVIVVFYLLRFISGTVLEALTKYAQSL